LETVRGSFVKFPENDPTAYLSPITAPDVGTDVVGGVTRWLGRRYLVGRLSLIYAL